MLAGLTDTCRYVVRFTANEAPRDPLAVVIHYLLGDVVNAARLALMHYLPLPLERVGPTSLREPLRQVGQVHDARFCQARPQRALAAQRDLDPLL